MTDLNAQVWTAQTSGTNAWLEKIKFISSDVGWCVGNAGTILYTGNGGASWIQQVSGTTSWLRDIHMINANEGWIVGQNGTVLHTTNGGGLWTPLPFPSSIELRALWRSSSDVLWVTGTPDNMYRSQDGGITWAEIVPTVGAELTALWFDEDGLHGWAAGLLTTNALGHIGQVRITTDGGENWSLSTQSQDHGWYQSVQFTDQENGWSCTGDGKIMRSTDGGETWEVGQTGPITGFYDILFINENEGWSVGGDGIIWHTLDGGIQWAPEISGSSEYLYDIEVLNTGEAWVAGSNGTILHRASSATTIQEPASSNMTIYPVPASDRFFISPGRAHVSAIQMYDTSARLVGSWNALDELSFRVHGLQEGMYMLHVHGREGLLSVVPMIIAH